MVNGSPTVHWKSFYKCPLHCKTYIAPKSLMQPAGVTGSWKVTDLKEEIVCSLLEASYFNIMQQWQLSTFNHQALDFLLSTRISHNLGIWVDAILHSPSQLLRVPSTFMLGAMFVGFPAVLNKNLNNCMRERQASKSSWYRFSRTFDCSGIFSMIETHQLHNLILACPINHFNSFKYFCDASQI